MAIDNIKFDCTICGELGYKGVRHKGGYAHTYCKKDYDMNERAKPQVKRKKELTKIMNQFRED